MFFDFIIGAIARLNAGFGQGSGPIFLDDVRCTGLEKRLFSCVHRGIDVNNCDHSKDAGVTCIQGKQGLIVGIWIRWISPQARPAMRGEGVYFHLKRCDRGVAYICSIAYFE